MALSYEFKEWFRKSVFNHSAGGDVRFNKLVKRLEIMEAGRTVRSKLPVQQAKEKIVPYDKHVYNSQPAESQGDGQTLHTTAKC
jgi:hypothetical protein